MGVKEGIRDLLEEVMSYRTVKIVKICDKRLASLHKTFMAFIFAFAFLSIIGNHNYMIFEIPNLTIQTYAEPPSAVVAPDLSSLSYCNTSLTDWSSSTYGNYTNMMCVSSLNPKEYAQPGSDYYRIGTSFTQTRLRRDCNDTGVGSGLTGCVTTEVEKASYFVTGTDLNNVLFLPTYSTSWGNSGTPSKIKLVLGHDEVRTYNPKTGEWPQMTVKEIVAAAGDPGEYDLDFAHHLMPVDVFGKYPSYRLTGMGINAQVSFTNTYATKPFSTQVECIITFSFATPGSWFEAAPQTFYTAGMPQMDTDIVIRDWRTVTVFFIPSGTLGIYEFYAMMAAVANAFVLIGMATAIVDILGAFVSETFIDDRFEDDGERQGLEEMLARQADVGVPFALDMLRLRTEDGAFGNSYEHELFQIKSEIARIVAMRGTKEPLPDLRLEEIKRKWKDNREEFTPDENQKSSNFKLVRKEDSNKSDYSHVGEDVFLRNGANVLGRGLAGCDVATISRTQILAELDEGARTLTLTSLRGPYETSYGAVKVAAAKGKVWKELRSGMSVVLDLEGELSLQIKGLNTQKTPHLNGVFTFTSHENIPVEEEEVDQFAQAFSWLTKPLEIKALPPLDLSLPKKAEP